MEKKKIFVAILGITNIGKTTQVQMLVERLKKENLLVEHIKYPVYDLEPTGPRINAYLRKGNPEKLNPEQFQELNAQNKLDFSLNLDKSISLSDVVIAEMYTGTSIAYGIGDGVSKEYLIKINQNLRKPDISILLDGHRFLDSIEQSHHYENDDYKNEKIRHAHLDLAKEFDWNIVSANQAKEQVNDQIFDLILRRK